VEKRSRDPFFVQLQADIQEGVDEADRGELIDEADVWKHVHAIIDQIEQRSRTL
jgi:predicted transcriptional regulator